MKDARAALEARNAHLEHRTGSAAGAAAGENPLRELKTEPQVVSGLRGWKEAGVMEGNDALHRLRLHFQATGLSDADRTLRAFHTAMKVNESTQMPKLQQVAGRWLSILSATLDELRSSGKNPDLLAAIYDA
jgi:hypothetical protein